MRFSTTIKRKYWDMKMQDMKRKGYFVEYKNTSDFWNKRLSKLQRASAESDLIDAVFLVGREAHRAVIFNIDTIHLHRVPARYRDALTTSWVWEITCWRAEP